jgi:hypothetical protein
LTFRHAILGQDLDEHMGAKRQAQCLVAETTPRGVIDLP